MKNINVSIIGATGYTGFELIKILLCHPYVKIKKISSQSYIGKDYASVFPQFNNIFNLKCEEFNIETFANESDIFFVALPHKIPMSIVPDLIASDKHVIDLSGDFRFSDFKKYEKAYDEKHIAKDLLKDAVYGLSEIYFDEICQTKLLANPGCYPTSILLPLIPLIRKNIIDGSTIISDSKSGVSGAGRGISLGTHYCETNESFKAYKIASHRHNPEIDEKLSIEAKQNINISFVPHLLPINRGMLSTIYANLKEDIKETEVINFLSDFYKDKPFIRVYPVGSFPNIAGVRNTNYCDIGIKICSNTKRLIIVSAIDNLIKGASGQAVQNMNIMLGLKESLALDNLKPFCV